MNPALERTQTLLSAFLEKHGGAMNAIGQVATRVMDACNVIEESWSGSFAGWHGAMYYDDFEKPSVHERFSGEWGGIHGIPNGWHERRAEDVAAKINDLVGDGFSVNALDEETKRLVALVDDLIEDVSLCLATLKSRPGTKSAEYAATLGRKSQLDEARADYINARMPKSLMSRDMEALRQGTMLPSWLYYMAVAVQARKTAEWYAEYQKNAERLARAVELESGHEVAAEREPNLFGLHPDIVAKCASLYAAGAYPEAAEKGFKVVRDRLRTLSGYETGSEAFGKGRLFIRGASAPNVEADFNQAVKFLTMAIDMFRNEKSHTSDANLSEPVRAYQYLALSSLAMTLLESTEIRP